MASLDSLRLRMVEAMGQFAKDVGFVGQTEGKLLGFLILADEALTQDDLMELSGYSRGNVSTALRTLSEAGFARRTSQRGSRRDYYEATRNLWRTTIMFVVHRISHQIDWVHGEFVEILAEAKSLDAERAEARALKRFARRVETLSNYTASARKLMSAVTRLVERNKNGE